MVRDLSLERTCASPGVCRAAGEIDMDDRGVLDRGVTGVLADLVQARIDPAARRHFEIQIAFDPIDDASATQRGEALIDAAANLTVLRVSAITQREHREPCLLKARRIVRHQGFIKIDRALRRIALAPGAGDQQQVRDLGHLRGGCVGHVDDFHREPQFGGGFTRAPGQSLGVTRFGAEQNGQRCARFRRGGGDSLLRCVGCLNAGQESGQPRTLLGGRGREYAVQRRDFVGTKRCASGQ